MPRMVYIKKVYPQSFLHLSTSGESFALRDFSASKGTEGRVIKRQLPPEWTTTRILQLASVAGNFSVEVPEQPIANYRYWHEQTLKLNAEMSVGKDPPPVSAQPPPRRIRDHVAYIIATVVAAVITAGILAWLKWK